METTALEEGLCPLQEGAAAFDSILTDIADLGIEQAGPPRLWRLDVAADCRFAEGAEGLAILKAVANTRLPRTEIGDRGRPVQTVMLYAPRGKRQIGVVYDKGIERGVASPGELIRFEGRAYWRGGQRPRVASIDPASMKRVFDGRFAALATSKVRIAFSTASEALREVARLTETGDIDLKLARAAFVALCEETTGLSSRWTPATASRRRKTLRAVGLSGSASAVFEERPLALGPFATDLVESPQWGLSSRAG